MKTYFILQYAISFRVDWRNLASNHYRLVLITARETPFTLRDNQRECFESIIFLSDWRLEAIQALIQNYQKENSNDEVFVVTNDEHCLLPAALIRAQLNIPGERPDLIKKFTDKFEMKQALANSNIRLPHFTMFDSKRWQQRPLSYLEELESTIGEYPMFAKPINLGGSQFAYKIEDKAELQKWLTEDSHRAEFEIDEFIEGEFFHLDSIIQNGEIIFFAPCLYAFPCFEFSLGKIAGSISVLPNSSLYYDLESFNQQVITSLGETPNCTTHLELFRKPNGELVFIEIAARAPGGMICEKHEIEFGFNFEEVHFRLQMGLSSNLIATKRTGIFSASAWIPCLSGEVMALPEKLPIKSQHDLKWKITVGDVLNASINLLQVAGTVILKNQDYGQLSEDFQSISSGPLYHSNH